MAAPGPVIWIAGLALLWAPGYLLYRRGGFAIQIAVGLAVWPVAFVWLPFSWLPVIALPVIAVALALLVVRARLRPPALVFFLAAGAAALRAHDIAGLAFPPWVDGVHHAMIIRALLDDGALPASYHWGFHVPAAILAVITGNAAPPDVPRLLLHYGQLLNALSFVTIYAAGRVLLRSRMAGVFAAVLACFVSYFPAYYLSWGRYTHLAGTLLLPALLIVLWRNRNCAVPVILAAGLALIHVRVAFFALAFALIVMKRRWAVVALIAALLIAPWLLHVRPIAGTTESHLIAARHNRELMALATGGISGLAGWLGMLAWGRIASAAWLALLVVNWRRLRWRPLALLAAWCGVVALVVTFWPVVASPDSAAITLFIPLSLAGAGLLAWVVPRRFAAVLAVAIAIGGATTLVDIVNPATILADDADLRAMRWIARNTPPGARFAVDARPWTGPAWVGVDGGYWISVATGRESILPPLLYAWTLPRAEVARINTVLEQWSDRRWDVLRGAGVTHIYCGSLSPPSRRATLLADPRARLIYRDGGAVVFELAP
ncbi:MAG: hypothetical protein AABO58_25615 [Acidobacteriota bacterium]